MRCAGAFSDGVWLAMEERKSALANGRVGWWLVGTARSSSGGQIVVFLEQTWRKKEGATGMSQSKCRQSRAAPVPSA